MKKIKYDRDYLINMYNSTSTDDGKGGIEPYKTWLERQLCRRLEKIDGLRPPTDKEVETWFTENIEPANKCSASSAIYKFRLWIEGRARSC